MRQADVSVVIPTHDRPASVVRALRALARQRCSPGSFEVVVSVDGTGAAGAGSANSMADLAGTAGLDLPYPLTVVHSEERQGAASARNRGAAEARGDLLVFLDDDIEADPGLIAAHVAAHHDGAHVAIGYLPPSFEPGRHGFFEMALRGWWEAMFTTMRRPGHRYRFRDLLSGNCSMPAALFERLGRFDPAFHCHEDYELGVRLIEQRAVMRFVESARGAHHERTTLPRALARKRDEGRADVLMLHKHPHLVPSVPLGIGDRHATRVQRLLRRLVFEHPASGRVLASATMRSLALLERGRFRGRWERRLNDLLHYWYWRGVADEIGSLEAVEAWLAGCQARSTWVPATLEVDLANGLDLVAAQVDRRRPDALRIMLQGSLVGEIAASPGAEGLAGDHLRAVLAGELAGPLLAALGRAGMAPVTLRNGKLAATAPVPSAALRL